ncbi:FAD-dependent monooxygenase [Psychromarinibacter sp. C21-152]|uniref:FAD-dependent monooxygenase n=1 Tax=Psychromarinibacter sediminicola TaxID=3033385 RepID=A0AAE3NTN4_9RHOB|nr:FAD-dependent monooxygenase [Psychromarinibacter sediminicola]MDF0602226.1 FAD-dependent monooxygenase [Psychromarinibacter sediminicola]
MALPDPTALVLGAGPAGLGAAALLARAGARVTCLDPRTGPEQAAAQAEHVHILPPDPGPPLRKAAPELAAALSGAAAPDWHYLRLPEGAARTGPFLSRDAAETALHAAATAAGVTFDYGVRPRALAHDTQFEVAFQDGARRADILVDATGAHRWVADALDALGAQLWLDEIAAPGRYCTWSGALPPEAPRRHAMLWQPPDAEASIYLIARADRRLYVTWRGAGAPEASTGPELAEALSRHGLGAMAEIAAAAGPLARIGYVAPPPRLLGMERPGDPLLPAWFTIGDALVQTPPRFGFGMASVFLQLAELASVLDGGPPEPSLLAAAVRERLAAMAEGVWLQAGVLSVA